MVYGSFIISESSHFTLVSFVSTEVDLIFFGLAVSTAVDLISRLAAYCFLGLDKLKSYRRTQRKTIRLKTNLSN